VDSHSRLPHSLSFAGAPRRSPASARGRRPAVCRHLRARVADLKAPSYEDAASALANAAATTSFPLPGGSRRKPLPWCRSVAKSSGGNGSRERARQH